MSDLLFEIGTEEIPASYLGPALAQLEDIFSKKAKELKVSYSSIRTLGTPRRFALLVTDLVDKQLDITEELLGPSKKAAFDGDDNPTKAAVGFARSKGADVSDLKVVDTPKGEYLMLVREVKGRETKELLPEVLQGIIGQLSFPKSMRWGSNLQPFARPIQWLVALYGEEVIPLSHEGIESSTMSGGHRFHANQRFEIRSCADYEAQLAEKYIIVDPKKRREAVVAEIKRALEASTDLTGGSVAIDEKLVDIVTNLVETPYGVCGVFDEKFLQLPDQVLITSMREHQKYFPVVDDKGSLLPGFIAVNNTKVNDTDMTRKGHQRVLRARLEDALFFFDSDKSSKLEDLIPRLVGIIFQAKLGTMLEKNYRLVKLVRIIGEKIDPSLIDDCCRAAQLCKADLLSDMVGEFPSLQGTMGEAYAINDGEKSSVATAIREHYMPKRAGAPVPTGDMGAILGLADRFDTLVGCFGIGQVPTGTADPFGLRRIALAILHIIEEKNVSISLGEIIQKALALYGDKVDGSADTAEAVQTFIKGRFSNDCVSRGSNAGAVAAAVSVKFDDIVDCLQRIDAIEKIRKDEGFKILSASYKRIRNIIKDNSTTTVNKELFQHDAESNLFRLFEEIRTEMQQLIVERKYTEALQVMLRMKQPVDTFFDDVMVMAKEEDVKQNRLNLLTAVGELILQVGDISKLQES